MTRSQYFRIGFLPGACALLAAAVAAGQLPAPEDLVYEIDTAALERLVADILPPELELPGADEWQSFWSRVETGLRSQSLDDLAWYYATVRQVCGYLGEDPATQPLADWLRQRLDYYEMANTAVRMFPTEPAAPATSAPRPPSTEAEARQAPLPYPARPPAVPPAASKATPGVEIKRHNLVRNVERWQEKLAGQPAPANAAALVPRLKKVFRREGLPPELVWLAEAESSLNPAARSPVGALGLFQLMPATARRFGLRTRFFDERKNPEKSARAAAQYLKFLYGRTGSWPLSLAAYNAGEGRVGRLLKRKKQSSFDGIADDLPLETQMYVPKVMALISLREKIDPAKMPRPAGAARLGPMIMFRLVARRQQGRDGWERVSPAPPPCAAAPIYSENMRQGRFNIAPFQS